MLGRKPAAPNHDDDADDGDDDEEADDRDDVSGRSDPEWNNMANDDEDVGESYVRKMTNGCSMYVW